MLASLPRSFALSIISQPFKRSQEGLFHGKMKRTGNNVPHSKHKTRRTWLPNVRSKRLPLEATGETLKLKVTTRALRCIKKAGGLDNYVLKTNSKLLGMEGMRLRILVRSRLEEEAQLKAKADQKEKAERQEAFLKGAKRDKRKAVRREALLKGAKSDEGKVEITQPSA